MIFSAIVFCAAIAFVILFQFALAIGKPWGQYAMGGKYPGKLPAAIRMVCLFQIIVLLLIAVIVLTRASLIFGDWFSFSKTAIWFVVVFSFVSAVLNSITPSKKERNIWAPVSFLLLITSVVVAVQ